MATEIERVFLLSCMPPNMPAGEVWRIEQGYLQPDPAQPLSEGRLRRTTHADGRVTLVHTVKSGVGRVREEHEQFVDPAAFQAAWVRTRGRRLSKVRTRVREGALTWEIDNFIDIPVVLAECELPSVDTPLPIPAWLQPCVTREVSDDPAYRNYQLAVRAGLAGGKSG